MAVNETIVTGRKFRKLVDESAKLWQRISFWTKASDVEFEDGKTAEAKMGTISGVTDSLTSTSSNIAASAKAIKTLNDKITELSSNLTLKVEEVYDSGISAVDNQNFSYTYVAKTKGTYMAYAFAVNDGEWGKCTNNYSTDGQVIYDKKYYNYVGRGSSFIAIVELDIAQIITVVSQSYRNGHSYHHIVKLC